MSHEAQPHITPYSTYAKVLLTLLLLTFLTVTIAHLHLGALSIAVAMIIACIKAALVLFIFMHLRFDNVIFKIMVTGVILLFATFIILTFADYWFR